MTRAEMLSRMSSTEYYEWMILEGVEPYGEKARELQAGIIASTTANFSMTRDSKSQPLKPSDFMVKVERSSAQTPKEMASLFQSMMQEQQKRG